MKYLTYIAMMLLVITAVAATSVDIVPDCGATNTWGDVCMEDDLVDEFSEVSRALTDGIRHDIKQDAKIELNKDVIIDTTLRTYKNEYYLTGEIEDRELFEDYVKSREKDWEEDEVGGGTSLSRVGRLIFGDSDTFWEFYKTGETLMQKLEGIFSTKDELETAHQRIDDLQSRIEYLETMLPAQEPSKQTHRADVIGADRKGLFVCQGNECTAVVPVN